MKSLCGDLVVNVSLAYHVEGRLAQEALCGRVSSCLYLKEEDLRAPDKGDDYAAPVFVAGI